MALLRSAERSDVGDLQILKDLSAELRRRPRRRERDVAQEPASGNRDSPVSARTRK